MDLTFHESDERLELYALNRLSDSDIVRIEEHLLVCDSCRDRLDVAANFAYSIREELKTQPVYVRRIPGWLSWLKQDWSTPRFALAGALALALIAAVIMVRGSHAPLASLASLQLTAMRGSGVASTHPARELELTFVDAPAATAGLSAEVVDEGGAPVWQGTPQAEKGGVAAHIAKELAPGEYYVRLYDSPNGAARRLAHEYSFRVKP